MRRRIAATAVLAVGLALGTAGCTFLAPQATAIKYNPSDGVSLNVGDVQLRNAFLISPKGVNANLVGVLINSGTSSIVVHLQYLSHGISKDIDVPLKGGEVISFGNPGVKQRVLRNIGTKAGALFKVFVQYGSVSGKNVLLPVLDGSQSYYTGLNPSPLPKPTPTNTVTPLPTTAP